MPVESEMRGVMVTGRGNSVAEGTEQQVCKYLVYYVTALSIVQIMHKKVQTSQDVWTGGILYFKKLV